MGGPDRSWGGREIEARPARVALGEGWRRVSGRYGGGKIEGDLFDCCLPLALLG